VAVAAQFRHPASPTGDDHRFQDSCSPGRSRIPRSPAAELKPGLPHVQVIRGEQVRRRLPRASAADLPGPRCCLACGSGCATRKPPAELEACPLPRGPTTRSCRPNQCIEKGSSASALGPGWNPGRISWKGCSRFSPAGPAFSPVCLSFQAHALCSASASTSSSAFSGHGSSGLGILQLLGWA